MELRISESGFQSFSIDAKENETLSIEVDKRINASLLITYYGEACSISSNIVLKDGSSLTVMLKNEMGKKWYVKQSAEVQKDAHLVIAYCDLNETDTNVDIDFSLQQEGANVLVRSAVIGNAKKHYKMTCVHECSHTVGLMENYAVVNENGNYRMEACGKIVKGAKESESHQTTRVLTMSEKHNSEVIPLLLIDENNVKASHATTLGQPDENQLYYLQTRGLNRNMALGLLTVGYLMPITELFDEKDYHEMLKNEIETKVGLHA